MLYAALLDLRLDIVIIHAPLASPGRAGGQAVYYVKKLCGVINSIRWPAMGALNLASLRTGQLDLADDPRGNGLDRFYGCLSRRGLYAAGGAADNDVTSMISTVSAVGWEWRWFRSRRPYL